MAEPGSGDVPTSTPAPTETPTPVAGGEHKKGFWDVLTSKFTRRNVVLGGAAAGAVLVAGNEAANGIATEQDQRQQAGQEQSASITAPGVVATENARLEATAVRATQQAQLQAKSTPTFRAEQPATQPNFNQSLNTSEQDRNAMGVARTLDGTNQRLTDIHTTPQATQNPSAPIPTFTAPPSNRK